MTDSARLLAASRKSRLEPEVNDRGPLPDSWQGYVLGQTVRALSKQQGDTSPDFQKAPQSSPSSDGNFVPGMAHNQRT